MACTDHGMGNRSGQEEFAAWEQGLGQGRQGLALPLATGAGGWLKDRVPLCPAFLWPLEVLTRPMPPAVLTSGQGKLWGVFVGQPDFDSVLGDDRVLCRR